MIYFIKGVTSGSVKIGHSADPERRLDDLKTGSAEPLELLGTIPGGAAEERRLHERFRRFRIRRGAEWFRGDEEFTRQVRTILRTPIGMLFNPAVATFWSIRGRTPGAVDGDVTLFCVRKDHRRNMPPDVDQMLGTLWPRTYFVAVDWVANVGHRRGYWPADHEMLREPLATSATDIWVAALGLSKCFVRWVPPALRYSPPPSDTSPPMAAVEPAGVIVEGSAVEHPTLGAGTVIWVEPGYRGDVAMVRFDAGSARGFFNLGDGELRLRPAKPPAPVDGHPG